MVPDIDAEGADDVAQSFVLFSPSYVGIDVLSEYHLFVLRRLCKKPLQVCIECKIPVFFPRVIHRCDEKFEEAAVLLDLLVVRVDVGEVEGDANEATRVLALWFGGDGLGVARLFIGLLEFGR